jgi:hypothetical protein
MADIRLARRIKLSLVALAISWLLSGLALSVHFRLGMDSFVFFFWSVPLFAMGWVLLGIPVIVMGTQILKLPRVVLGVSGAAVGIFIMLLPVEIEWMISLGAKPFKLDWSILKGWPGFGAAIGAGGMLFYHWLLSRAVPSES